MFRDVLCMEVLPQKLVQSKCLILQDHGHCMQHRKITGQDRLRRHAFIKNSAFFSLFEDALHITCLQMVPQTLVGNMPVVCTIC